MELDQYAIDDADLLPVNYELMIVTLISVRFVVLLNIDACTSELISKLENTTF